MQSSKVAGLATLFATALGAQQVALETTLKAPVDHVEPAALASLVGASVTLNQHHTPQWNKSTRPQLDVDAALTSAAPVSDGTANETNVLDDHLSQPIVFSGFDRLVRTEQSNMSREDDCTQELIPDMSYIPLVAILCGIILAAIWDFTAYPALGYEPPLRKPSAVDLAKPPASKDSTTSVGTSSSDASKADADQLEKAEWKAKLLVIVTMSIILLMMDAGYALPVSYLPCLIISKGGSQTIAGLAIGLYGAGVMLGAIITPRLMRSVPPLVIVRSSMLLVRSPP